MSELIEWNETTPIHDLVFPIVKIHQNKIVNHIGTGFYIGSRGFAVTAAHVIESLNDLSYHALFMGTMGLEAHLIQEKESHPTEDIGIIRIPSRLQKSFIKISNAPESASCPYDVWGYPHEVAEEIRNYATSGEEARGVLPEMIYSAGHVRRVINRELPFNIYRGKSFYELSSVAGDGSSGGPMISRHPIAGSWAVVGVYVGSKNKVGYAMRTKIVQSWVPKSLGNVLSEEI